MQIKDQDQHEGRGEEARGAGVHPGVQVSNSKVENCFSGDPDELSSSSSRPAGAESVSGQSAPSAAELLENSVSSAEGGARRRRTPGGHRITPPPRARVCAHALSGLRRPKPARLSGPKMGLIPTAVGACRLLYWCCWCQTRGDSHVTCSEVRNPEASCLILQI